MKKKLFIWLYIILFLFCFSSVNLATSNQATLGNSIAETSLNLYSPSCLLMEASTGKVLYEKDMHAQMYPASTTKIMTAILALENCKLTDVATVSYNAVHSIPSGYSYANLQVGEELTIDQLLHVLLIPSANDAAVVLAEHIAGSVESFATMMNTKAIEIGCENTHFVNPNGVHDEQHYSTAYDLALMGKYAMQNDIFRSIVTTTRYTLPTTNKYDKEDRIFNTTNELLKEDYRQRADNYYYPACTGIKTGYTDPAKNCIVASAKKDGIEYIVVVLGAERTSDGLSGRNLDCITLFNYAFENYTVKQLHSEYETIQQISIINATKETRNLDVLIQNSIQIVTNKNDELSDITPTIEIDPTLRAPISKNTVIGKLSYTIDGITYSSNLLAGNTVEESQVMSQIILLSIAFIFILIAYCILRSNKNVGKRSKKRK